MNDYHDLYLKWGFYYYLMYLKYLSKSLKKYGPCPSDYLSAPGLGLDVMLKMAITKLQLLRDHDIYIFFE